MTKDVSPFLQLNKKEIKRSVRDGLITVAAGAVLAGLGYIEGMDTSIFGEWQLVAQALIASFVIPLLNRALNIIRVQ